MSNTANLKVKFGDPEHIVTRDRAVTLVANLMKFKPESKNEQDITKNIVGDKKTFDVNRIKDAFGIEAAGPGDAAEKIAESVITRLEGPDTKFTRFTAESLAVLTKPMLQRMGQANFDEKSAVSISSAIDELPLSNGKTFTSLQALRVEKQILNENDFHKACKYATDDARYPKTWIKPEFGSKESINGEALKVVVPRGGNDMQAFVAIAETPFTNLSDAQQDAVVNMYTNSNQIDMLNNMLNLENKQVDDKLSLQGLDDLSDKVVETNIQK